MKENLKNKITVFYEKYSDTLIAWLWLVWLIAYGLFCHTHGLLLLGVSITSLMIVEFHWIHKKLELRDDILDCFDRLTSYADAILQQNKSLQKELSPFRDEYFRDLSSHEIAELAKTRLRVGAEAQKYLHALEDIKDCLTELDVSNTHISRALNKIDEVIDENIQ